MKVSLKSGFEYIPVWNGNRDNPEEEQIKVHFRFLSTSDISDCIINGKYSEEEEFKKYVNKIENLEVDGEEATAEMVFNKEGLMSLGAELKLAYKKESEFDKKK